MSLENIRRMAERGLKLAQANPPESAYIDCFQHILDEYKRTANAEDALNEAVSLLRECSAFLFMTNCNTKLENNVDDFLDKNASNNLPALLKQQVP